MTNGQTKVAVVGAGNGGLAVAGYLGLAGHRVNLYDIRPEALAPVQANGGIRVTGKAEGFAPIQRATLDPGEAVEDARAVFIVVPGPDQGAAARALAPHLKRGQVVVVKPGGTGGALEVAAVLAAAGRRDVLVTETDGFLFACSIKELGVSAITAVKKRFGVAALPARQTPAALELVQALLPQAVAAPSVLHTGLANMNPVLHVAPMVANAGRMEFTGGDFEFYGEGITPTVARAVESYDAERLAVAERLGVKVPTLRQWIQETYGVTGTDLYQIIQTLNREVYKTSRAPGKLNHRYLTEDVPCGTVPVASLGESLGVPVPIHRHLVHLASLLCQVDFHRSGRTVDKLGLGGLDVTAIRELVL